MNTWFNGKRQAKAFIAGKEVAGIWKNGQQIFKKQQSVALTNMLQYADFSSLVGWLSNPPLARLDRTVDNGVMTLTIIDESGAAIYNMGPVRYNLAYLAGHLYYLRASMKWDYNTIPPSSTTRTHLIEVGVSVQIVSANSTGEWQTLSGVYLESAGVDGRFSALSSFRPVTNYVNGVTAYTREPMLLDLTAAFGAGNEPAKEWCDANIPFFTGTIHVDI